MSWSTYVDTTGERVHRLPKCGTLAGYMAHWRRGETCESCRRAHGTHLALHRVRTGRATKAYVPLALLGELLAHAPAELVMWAEEELALGAVPAARLAAELAKEDT